MIENYRKTRKTHSRGTRANQPLAAEVLEGTLYFVTDEGVIEQSNGTIWQSFSGTGGSSSIVNNSILISSVDGEDGFDGFPGLKGIDGAVGATGIQGAQGVRGYSGLDGIDGENTEIMIVGQAVTSGGGGTPGGSDTQVQFNDSGIFGGDAGLTYIKATDILVLLGLLDLSGAAAGQVKFPATQNPSSNANTFDDYKEIDVTLTDNSGAGLSITNNRCFGIKKGKDATVYFDITYPATVNGASASLAGLPFLSKAGGGASPSSVSIGYNGSAIAVSGYVQQNSTTMFFYSSTGGTPITNAQLSGATLRGVMIYYTDS